MKKLFIALIAVTLMVGMTTGAVAALSTGNSNTYTLTSVSTVSFYLVDWGSFDNTVTLTATNILGGALTGLQYSLDNISWSNFTEGKTQIFKIDPSTHTELVYLRLLTDTSADRMTFQSYSANSGTSTSPEYLDLYTGLKIKFDSITTHAALLTNSGSDKLAAVPVPAAVWLFATGLVGLVGIRRRFQK